MRCGSCSFLALGFSQLGGCPLRFDLVVQRAAETRSLTVSDAQVTVHTGQRSLLARLRPLVGPSGVAVDDPSMAIHAVGLEDLAPARLDHDRLGKRLSRELLAVPVSVLGLRQYFG